MPPNRGSKRQRYGAIFAQAALELAAGKKVAVRPESQTDYRTIMNYWYDWRKVHHGVGCKSADAETRRVADVVLNSTVSVDTDANGRVLLSLRPRITPKADLTEQLVQAIDPEAGTTMAFSTHHGASAPAAEAPIADHYMEHTKPWQDWFKTWTDMSGMLHCLDSIPRELRANPDLAALDDLPLPDSPEGLAWKARFRENADA